jgi:electron transfer flavoprotein alpha subunit
MSGVLVVMEQSGGVFNPMSLETLTAGQQIAAALGVPCSAAVLGKGLAGLEASLSGYALDKAYSVDHPLLAHYTADGFTLAVEALVRQAAPDLVLFPHTYQVRDFAPRVATRFSRVLVSDVTRIEAEGGKFTFVRLLFQGKLNGDITASGAGPHFASVQAGSYRADDLKTGSCSAETVSINLTAEQIRTRPEPPFRESARAVDLSSADKIVSVGRGIKDQENIALIQELADVLGAEIAASRPICDNGWLPMERQVGSSGQTVAPKLYLAVGISGAIQHLVGMKGAKSIVAINKDANAPIFEVADIGIVGDLFEVVPALIAEIKKRK